MSLRAIYGHEAVRDRLAGALAAGRFPQVALFAGAAGVGKQRVALWAGQGLLCDAGPGAPCGSCGPCRQVLALGHPDLHWFVPVPRLSASDPKKQLDEVREALGTTMQERREQPLWRRPEGMVSHPLASVRELQRVVGLTPFAASRKVVILGDAERLVVQEASQEAANALLKVLEEPPRDTTLILTSSEPQALLPTIRSRVVTVRIPRVTDEAVRECLVRELEPPPRDVVLERLTLLAGGAVGRALAAADREAADGPERTAQAFLAAVRRREGAWLPQALAQPPWAARGGFTGLLDALAVELRAELETGAQQAERSGLGGTLEALRRVEATRTAAQGNANPQLALAVLADDLETLL